MTSQIGYLKLLITRSILSGPLDFEIKRKTLTFVDADANANADARGSTIALRERCSGELKM